MRGVLLACEGRHGWLGELNKHVWRAAFFACVRCALAERLMVAAHKSLSYGHT